MDWRVISGALAVVLMALVGTFFAVLEGRDAAALETLEGRHDWLVAQHLHLRDRVRSLEQAVSALQGSPSPPD